MQRWIAGAVALFNTANGLAMLFASSIWWVSVPGFNPHFVQDVGAAFLAAGRPGKPCATPARLLRCSNKR
jgi:hypothetical protein